jgi:hypothetical protein
MGAVPAPYSTTLPSASPSSRTRTHPIDDILISESFPFTCKQLQLAVACETSTLNTSLDSSNDTVTICCRADTFPTGDREPVAPLASHTHYSLLSWHHAEATSPYDCHDPPFAPLSNLDTQYPLKSPSGRNLNLPLFSQLIRTLQPSIHVGNHPRGRFTTPSTFFHVQMYNLSVDIY